MFAPRFIACQRNESAISLTSCCLWRMLLADSATTARTANARTRKCCTWAHMFGAVWKSRSTATRTVFTKRRIPTGQDLSDSETRVFYVTAFCFLRSTLHRQRSGTWLREEQGRGGGTERHGPLRWRVPSYLLSRSSRSPERVFEREGKSSPSPPHPYVRCPYSRVGGRWQGVLSS